MVRVRPTWRSRSKELCLPTPAGEPGSGGCSDGCVRASEPACEVRVRVRARARGIGLGLEIGLGLGLGLGL